MSRILTGVAVEAEEMEDASSAKHSAKSSLRASLYAAAAKSSSFLPSRSNSSEASALTRTPVCLGED